MSDFCTPMVLLVFRDCVLVLSCGLRVFMTLLSCDPFVGRGHLVKASPLLRPYSSIVILTKLQTFLHHSRSQQSLRLRTCASLFVSCTCTVCFNLQARPLKSYLSTTRLHRRSIQSVSRSLERRLGLGLGLITCRKEIKHD